MKLPTPRNSIAGTLTHSPAKAGRIQKVYTKSLYSLIVYYILFMATLYIDDALHGKLKRAIERNHPDSYGQIKREVRIAIEERIKVLDANKIKKGNLNGIM